jgi:hypothetical protein
MAQIMGFLFIFMHGIKQDMGGVYPYFNIGCRHPVFFFRKG